MAMGLAAAAQARGGEMSLPQFQATIDTIERVFNQMQTVWGQAINPVINRAQNNSTIIPNLTLATGDNVIPHTLNRTLVGWSVVRQRSAATFYDKQESNSRPNVNLILNASAAVVIDLEVF